MFNFAPYAASSGGHGAMGCNPAIVPGLIRRAGVKEQMDRQLLLQPVQLA